MDSEMVAPSQLHRDLEGAAERSGEERKKILVTVLTSQNLAVIRRIPELLSPLTEGDKEDVLWWAESSAQDEDVSKRDFVFHLLVSCEIPAERILDLLERNKTYSRNVLEHIQQFFRGDKPVERLDEYFLEVAETLITGEEVSPRDRGRHMLMTLVHSSEDWQILATRFGNEFADLRQGVLERFLRECADEVALTAFVENITGMCMALIQNAMKGDVHGEASHMHWVLTCWERLGRPGELQRAANLFKTKFDTALPRSLQYRIEALFPKRRVETVRDPGSVDEALRCGWIIRTESGRQVVLVKDGRSITRYRSSSKTGVADPAKQKPWPSW